MTAGRPRWEDENPDEDDPDNDSSHSSPSPPDQPSDDPAGPPTPRGAHIVPREQAIPDPEATQPKSPDATTDVPADDSNDIAHMVDALRVVQRLHDEGALAPGWSITDATLVYWAMISPGVHDALGSVGMTEKEHLTAMRRLLTHGLIDRGNHPRGISDG